MKNRKDLVELIVLGVITITLLGILITTGINFKKQENTAPSTSSSTSIKEENSNKKEEKEEKEEDSQEEIDKSIPTISPTPTPSEVPIPSSPNNTKDEGILPTAPQEKSEEDVVAYFTTLDSSLAGYTDEANPSFREKAKSVFTTSVDFLFYNKEIHGYTFSSLKDSTKQKVLKIILNIDHKIDTYFPNYKTTIKEKAQNLKGKAALLYLETTKSICEKIGSDACNEAREDFKTMKESFGFTWDIIKSAATTSGNYIKTILKEWYESIK